MVKSSNISMDVKFLMYVVRTMLWNPKKKREADDQILIKM